MTEVMDRLGRLSWACPQCARRKAGQCQTCPNPVDGTVGVAYYCTACRQHKQRQSVMRWQRNNLDVVATGARRRRWLKKHGRRPPKEKLTPSEAGKLGGKLGSDARIAKLGPERVKAIALHAVRTRWARHSSRRGANDRQDSTQ